MSALCNYAGLLKRSREENHLGGADPSSAQSVDDGVSGAPPQTLQVMPHILYACERESLRGRREQPPMSDAEAGSGNNPDKQQRESAG